MPRPQTPAILGLSPPPLPPQPPQGPPPAARRPQGSMWVARWARRRLYRYVGLLASSRICAAVARRLLMPGQKCDWPAHSCDVSEGGAALAGGVQGAERGAR